MCVCVGVCVCRCVRAPNCCEKRNAFHNQAIHDTPARVTPVPRPLFPFLSTQSLLWGHMKDKPIVPAVRELLNDLVILRRGMAGVPPRTPDGLIDFSAVEQVSNFLTLFQGTLCVCLCACVCVCFLLPRSHSPLCV